MQFLGLCDSAYILNLIIYQSIVLRNIRIKEYSVKEERINIRSHAFGLLLSLAALSLLMIKAAEESQLVYFVAYLIYGLSQVAVFSASTLYHAAREKEHRSRLNIFDHSAIYLSIAGTYTPIAMLVIPGVWGWSVFAVIWLMALIGVVLKLFFTGQFDLISTIGYVGMGLIILVAIKPLITHMSLWGLIWLACGGVFYISGSVLYRLDNWPYNHAAFHFFVLIAAICHFFMIYFHT
jgi:hemolysin III